MLVSTHARARRATFPAVVVDRHEDSFNPRPRTAGDIVFDVLQSRKTLFQPTPAHGGRHAVTEERRNVSGVSTHARARRATICWTSEMSTDSASFNPRPRTAGDNFRPTKAARA